MNRRSTSLVVLGTALLLALCGGVAVGAADVTANQIAKNAVRSKHVKDNAITGKDVKESTLGTVPDASAVGGTTVRPLAASLPLGSPLTRVAGGTGWSVEAGCVDSSPDVFQLRFSRTATGPPMTVALTSSTGAGATHIGAGTFIEYFINPAAATVTVTGNGSRGTIASLAGQVELNAYGSNDCFLRGTVTQTP